MLRASWGLVLAPFIVGCSSDAPALSVTAPPPADASDAKPIVDASVSDTFDAFDAYEASRDVLQFPPLTPYQRFPQVDYLGGALLTSIEVVTITFSSDDPTLVSHLQQFGDTITTTPWWSGATSEYCVLPQGAPCIGPGTSGGHVVLTETPPTTLVDAVDNQGSTVVSFIQAHIDSGQFPAPNSQIVYQIYFPSSTTVQLAGANGCTTYDAYHNSAPFTPKGGGTPVETAYAIEVRCGNEKSLTFAASHELIEAATDAHPGKDRGYVMQDYGWYWFGGEVGDLCDYPWGSDQMTESTYNVQRGWSNKSARAGHDPCVAEPGNEIYFNVAPEAGSQEVYLAVGESITFDVDAYADGTAVDWNLSAEDVSTRINEPASLTFAFDHSVINAGQQAKLTITLASQPKYAFAPYVIHSVSNAGHHWWGATVRLK